MRLVTGAIALMVLLPGSAGATRPSEEIIAPGPQGDLHGSFIAPESGEPMVLIIPGSGPTDRDGNNSMGLRAAPYRLLAEGLAGKGIGTVRIDKRGMFASGGAVPDPNSVTIGDYVADVESWVGAIRAKTGADCVWLAGHSEGGLVALAASERVEGLCGLVLIATPGRTLGAILREQFQANPANAPVLADAFGAIDRLERGEHVDVAGFHPALQPVFAPQVQDYLIELMALDPAALAASTDLPMLILQGGKDIQVSLADAAALRAARHDAAYVALSDVNHVLKAIESDDREANVASYADPSRPIAPGVVEAIAGFIASAEGDE